MKIYQVELTEEELNALLYACNNAPATGIVRQMQNVSVANKLAGIHNGQQTPEIPGEAEPGPATGPDDVQPPRANVSVIPAGKEADQPGT